MHHAGFYLVCILWQYKNNVTRNILSQKRNLESKKKF
jgi:hypothetical protein